MVKEITTKITKPIHYYKTPGYVTTLAYHQGTQGYMYISCNSSHFISSASSHFDQNLHLVVLVVDQSLKPFLLHLGQLDPLSDHLVRLHVPCGNGILSIS
jgi:hypothetical protein